MRRGQEESFLVDLSDCRGRVGSNGRDGVEGISTSGISHDGSPLYSVSITTILRRAGRNIWILDEVILLTGQSFQSYKDTFTSTVKDAGVKCEPIIPTRERFLHGGSFTSPRLLPLGPRCEN